jgi:iron complex outermembrane receptor protein
VATFFNEYRDLMSITKGTVTTGTNPTRTVVPFTFANDTEAYTYGGEILLDWQATDRWNLSTSYSFLDINVKGPSEADEKLSPQGQFNLHSHYNVTDTVSLDNMLYYVSALPGYDVEGYWRFDTRIGWEATDNIELSLVGQNLFDDKHREFSSPTALGATTVDRAVYGSVTWRF